MGFMFKKDTIKSLSDLQTADAEMYSALMAEAKSGSDELIQSLQSKLAVFEAQTAKQAEQSKIKSFAAKLGLEDLGDELVNKETPYNEACEALLNGYEPEAETDDVQEFLESSAAAVGLDSTKDGDEVTPKTFAEAINYVSERDKCTKVEASKKAKVEFKELFNNLYKKEAV